MILTIWFGGWVLFVWIYLAAKFAANKWREDIEFELWRKARMAKYRNAPFVDVSYRRFCDETGRYYAN